MSNEVITPDFDFSAIYYPEILIALLAYRRQYLPEYDSTNEYDPIVQLERAFALVGHRDAVLLDAVAREALLPTAELLSSVRSLFKLIDYTPKEAIPAVVDILAQLTSIYVTDDNIIIPVNSIFATEAIAGESQILFEALTGVLDAPRTDRITFCFAEEDGTFTDYTTQAQTPSSTFSPWITPVAGDKLYFGHGAIIWTKPLIDVTVAASGIEGVWEFYDGEWQDQNPDNVSLDGDELVFTLTSLLGTVNRKGAAVRIIYLPTGAYEDVESIWESDLNKCRSTGLLGQTTPSVDPLDYAVGVEWHPLESNDVFDGTEDLTTSGYLNYELPQTSVKDWNKTTVNDEEAFFIRYRIIEVDSPSSPTLDTIEISSGTHYVVFRGTQGTTVEDNPLGSSNGSPNQKFPLSTYPYLEGTAEIEVDEGAGFIEWTRVTNFYASRPWDRVYKVELNELDIPEVIFSDSINGKIPPAGTNNIKATYRVGGDVNGNVAAETITVNRTGVAFLGRISNPRPATGWAPRQGEGDSGFLKLKEAGPASIRSLERATTLEDAEDISVNFLNSEGTSVVERAVAFEEAFGPKTIELVAVGTGGGLLSSGDIAELERFLNGVVEEQIYGKALYNHRIFVSNYLKHVINVTATVYGGSQVEIENAVRALITPLALKPDGITYVWNFGGIVPTSRINYEIFNVTNVRNVIITEPASDVVLGERELPYLGTLSITVIP